MTPRTMMAAREAAIRFGNPLCEPDCNCGFAALGRELDAERAVSKALAEALRTCREYVEHDGCVTIADNALAQYAASFPEKETNLEPR